MKTFGKIVICIVVVLIAVGIGYLAYNGEETSGNTLANTATNTKNTNNNVQENKTVNEIDENKDYIGEEENKEEEPVEDEESKQTSTNENTKTDKNEQTAELTGEDKAVDVVKKQYALDGQTVEVHHMEGENYVVSIKDGTGATWWYLVDGTTWEAEEY